MARRELSVSRQAASRHPARSNRCSAVRSEPGLTLNVPGETYSIPPADAEAVHWLETERLQDEQVESALNDVGIELVHERSEVEGDSIIAREGQENAKGESRGVVGRWPWQTELRHSGPKTTDERPTTPFFLIRYG